MQGWKTYKLGEILKVKHGYAFKGENFTTQENKNLLLTPGNFQMSGGIKFNWGKQKFYNGKYPNDYILEEGDLVIAMTDLTQSCDILGAPIKIKDTKFNYLHNQRLGLIIENRELVFTDYLFHYFNTYQYRSRLIATKSGSTVSHTAPERIYECEINLPHLKEQKAIASILSALDEKIELNLQMNKTLEEMAKALYKHWFVDFGPFQNGNFIESELGMIPEGWEVKKIGASIETLGGGTPSTAKNEYWENGEILWYSPTDLTREKSLFSIDTAKKITSLGLQKSSARMFRENSLLMSSRATIGLLTINTKPACTNQGFITMLPNEKISVYQLYFWVKQNIDLIISKSNGSTFKEISKSNFRDLDVLIGKDIDSYLRETKDVFNQINSNIQENQTLTTLRDTLLPKLISGEIRVKDIEQLVAAAL
ncbi:type I restriction enzyme S subunit [Pedobacter sp. CG_S7]|uniref:restriction endonuclease subunit S n=1 Tax=Pedobacter sp. CG_S7 TaxID=3143930 RepID=UPI00339433B7